MVNIYIYIWLIYDSESSIPANISLIKIAAEWTFHFTIAKDEVSYTS